VSAPLSATTAATSGSYSQLTGSAFSQPVRPAGRPPTTSTNPRAMLHQVCICSLIAMVLAALKIIEFPFVFFQQQKQPQRSMDELLNANDNNAKPKFV
jgi:hypothetical protein